jgi:hypothetical protein
MSETNNNEGKRKMDSLVSDLVYADTDTATSGPAKRTSRRNQKDKEPLPSALFPDTSTADADATAAATTTTTTTTTATSATVNTSNSNNNDTDDQQGEIVSTHIRLDPLPAATHDSIILQPLSRAEQAQLETALEFGDILTGDTWRDDWSGNLAYADKEISNPAQTGRSNKSSSLQESFASIQKQSFQQSLVVWAQNNTQSNAYVQLLANLLRYVYHMNNTNDTDKEGSTTCTPDAAKRVLASADLRNVGSMVKAIRRTCYDPTVLRQDGWTTQKSEKSVGATGGPFLIGDFIRWEGSDAVVISYVHDAEIGDLWKAIWIDGVDVTEPDGSSSYYETFDLEAEELFEAKRKWERRLKMASQQQQQSGNSDSRRSARSAVNSDFTIKGIQDGIVLATSYSKGARPGVYWPARVLHASESTGPLSQGKRSTSKQKVELVFLAPYWDADEHLGFGGRSSSSSRRAGSLSETSQSAFNSGPLLHWETVEATDEMIKEYPHDGQEGLDIYQLRMAFRFTGLPKAAFPRFLDSNRLAMGLKMFAKRHLKTKLTATDRASAGLFETHPMSVKTPVFPHVVLHLPFSFILSQLPRPIDQIRGSSDNGQSNVEPVLQLGSIVDAMKPPTCWGITTDDHGHSLPPDSPSNNNGTSNHQQPPSTPGDWLSSFEEENGKYPSLELDNFVRDLLPLVEVFNRSSSSPPVAALLTNVTRLLSQLSEVKLQSTDLEKSERLEKLRSLVTFWINVKTHGEDAVSSVVVGEQTQTGTLAVAEWRRASERIYKYMTAILSDEGIGDGVSTVLTDSRCNGHRTADGCFERAVRLPAALKGAKLAGAGASKAILLVTDIPAHYYDFVEEKLLIKAHSASYLKRMKSRCAAARTDTEGIVLTDDSSGNGGEDTSKPIPCAIPSIPLFVSRVRKFRLIHFLLLQEVLVEPGEQL